MNIFVGLTSVKYLTICIKGKKSKTNSRKAKYKYIYFKHPRKLEKNRTTKINNFLVQNYKKKVFFIYKPLRGTNPMGYYFTLTNLNQPN